MITKIDNPMTGQQESLSQEEFNRFMSQTNGAVLKWIVKPAPTRSISLRLARFMVARYNENHDELGRFASSNDGAGGNGLNHREVYLLQNGVSDSQKPQVYAAEEKFKSQTTNDTPPPRGPSGEMLKKGEITQAQYDAEYKAYSKAHAAWMKESSKSIESDLGEKYLDGSTKGTQAYVDSVVKSDWFVSAFGDGEPIGQPKVALKPSNRFAGRYFVGTKGGVGVSGLDVNKGYSLHEPTLIHEIAHYATTISQTTPHAGHGEAFTKNHIFVASKVAGPEYAAGLQKAYEEGGVKVG